MTNKRPTSTTRDYRQEPTYWFAILEIAREQGDFERAADAKRQLKRLGVVVSYDRPAKGVTV